MKELGPQALFRGQKTVTLAAVEDVLELNNGHVAGNYKGKWKCLFKHTSACNNTNKIKPLAIFGLIYFLAFFSSIY